MSLAFAGRRLAAILEEHNQKLVLVESCTAGLASATLARTPYISRFHCGGMIVYRNETKQRYLQISAAELEQHGPVSLEMTQLLGIRVLMATPEADISASITGHLGPECPPELDGVVYLGLTRRLRDPTQFFATLQEYRCAQRRRAMRQAEAASTLLLFVAGELQNPPAHFLNMQVSR